MPRPYGGACGAAAALTGSEGRRVCEQDGRQWRDRAGLVFGAFRRHLRSSLLVFLTALLAGRSALRVARTQVCRCPDDLR